MSTSPGVDAVEDGPVGPPHAHEGLRAPKGSLET
jgi:hypothetical protein